MGGAMQVNSSNITSLLSYYKHERNIYGRCPHCDETFRLSEVKLTYGKEPPKDLLGRMKRDRDALQEKIEELESQIGEMEDGHEIELDDVRGEGEKNVELLNEKWKGKVDNEVQRQLGKREREIRQDAIAKSRAGQLGKTLEKIAPMFPGFGHNPYDVRPIFDPIDFVVFDGYYQGGVTDIVFIEFKTGQSRMSPIQKSIRSAVERKRVRFEERRLRKDALRLLTQGRRPQKLIE